MHNSEKMMRVVWQAISLDQQSAFVTLLFHFENLVCRNGCSRRFLSSDVSWLFGALKRGRDMEFQVALLANLDPSIADLAESVLLVNCSGFEHSGHPLALPLVTQVHFPYAYDMSRSAEA